MLGELFCLHDLASLTTSSLNHFTGNMTKAEALIPKSLLLPMIYRQRAPPKHFPEVNHHIPNVGEEAVSVLEYWT